MELTNRNLIKEINLNHVRRIMKRVDTATKPQLAEMTKLSVVTINSLVKELLKNGEVFEDELVTSNGGRPALAYRYNYDYSFALVIYMNEKQGQDVILATVVNLQGDVLARREYFIPIFDREPFVEMIDHFLTMYPSIKVVGIGLPGQSVNGEIKESSHETLKGIRIIEDLKKEFGLQVIIENDVNAAIVGHCTQGEYNEDQSVVGIYFPMNYPPGMGIYLDGRIIKGKDGMAGEIKYLPLDVNWGTTMANNDFTKVVFKIIHTVNIILAPDTIVIYQKIINEEQWKQSWEEYKSKNYMPTNTEVKNVSTFHEDFEEGMKWITLKELEPNINISVN